MLTWPVAVFLLLSYINLYFGGGLLLTAWAEVFQKQRKRLPQKPPKALYILTAAVLLPAAPFLLVRGIERDQAKLFVWLSLTIAGFVLLIKTIVLTWRTPSRLRDYARILFVLMFLPFVLLLLLFPSLLSQSH